MVQTSVIIPFHIAYGAGIKYTRNGVDDKVLHLRQAHVEDHLVSSECPLMFPSV